MSGVALLRVSSLSSVFLFLSSGSQNMFFFFCLDGSTISQTISLKTNHFFVGKYPFEASFSFFLFFEVFHLFSFSNFSLFCFS